MNLSQLLVSRSALVRQARLANIAHAYVIMRSIDERIRRARLRGRVCLEAVDPEAERFAPRLIALQGSQAVLDEHFDESDLVRLADALAFVASDHSTPREFEFHLERLLEDHGSSLAQALREAGVTLQDSTAHAPDASADEGAVT